eukprot:m.41058 g.41058  ORF g.41058 m.41058 type:complete len:102 (-) comp12802_c0_seq1:611-916(-)
MPLNRETRKQLGEDTFRRTSSDPKVMEAKAGTITYMPAELPLQLTSSATKETEFEILNMTTLGAVHHLQAQSDDQVTILNFASAKNPGLSCLHKGHECNDP